MLFSEVKYRQTYGNVHVKILKNLKLVCKYSVNIKKLRKKVFWANELSFLIKLFTFQMFFANKLSISNYAFCKARVQFNINLGLRVGIIL